MTELNDIVAEHTCRIWTEDHYEPNDPESLCPTCAQIRVVDWIEAKDKELIIQGRISPHYVSMATAIASRKPTYMVISVEDFQAIRKALGMEVK